MTSASSRVAGLFDRSAGTYDEVGVEWFRPIAQGLVDELAPRAGERVLDIGCGRGAATLPLARAVGGDGHVLGIDLSARMVELTAVDLADLPQVEIRLADASDPSLPSASFDVVASSLVVFFLPDPAVALRAWTELLVSGGRLGVSTFGRQDERWQSFDDVFTPYLPPQMLDARTSGARGPFASDEGVEDLLRGAGLQGVRTEHRTVEAVFRDTEQYLTFTWSHGQRAMWEAVPEDARGTVRGQLADLARDLSGGGPLTLTQDVRYTLGARP